MLSFSSQVHRKAYIFLNSGFLDPDELSSMNEGVHKGGKRMLPGIQEEIDRSTDSISTLGSDTLTLESVETNNRFFFIPVTNNASNKTKVLPFAPSN